MIFFQIKPWVAFGFPYLLIVDCEQPLFFFRLSKGSARARERWAAKPSATLVVICVSRTFCSTDQEKRETARSLVDWVILHWYACGVADATAARSLGVRSLGYKIFSDGWITNFLSYAAPPTSGASHRAWIKKWPDMNLSVILLIWCPFEGKNLVYLKELKQTYLQHLFLLESHIPRTCH